MENKALGEYEQKLKDFLVEQQQKGCYINASFNLSIYYLDSEERCKAVLEDFQAFDKAPRHPAVLAFASKKDGLDNRCADSDENFLPDSDERESFYSDS